MQERLTVKEYAKLNHISVCTVRRLIHSGALPFLKFGGTYRIPAEAEPVEQEPEYPQQFKAGEFAKLMKSLPI